MSPQPRLYGELAAWWPALSPPEDYLAEAAFFWQALCQALGRPPQTVLELGSGGGNNASHLKAYTRLTLVDLSPAMLAVSQALNPECEHVVGDMRSVRLGRSFEAVFIHDAIDYMTSLPDLRQALNTAAAHLPPGGVLLAAPDYTRENYQDSTDWGGGNSGAHEMRYLEWCWDPDPADSTYIMDFAYLLKLPDNSVRCEYDRHICGLFSRAEWLEALDQAGFDSHIVHITDRQLEPAETEVFIGMRR